jgi:carboxylesterase
VTVVRLEDSYHVATLDNDAERIYEQSAAFVARVTSPA